MPNRIKIRNKTTTGAPAPSDLLERELCLVEPDNSLYIKKSNGSVIVLSGGPSGGPTTRKVDWTTPAEIAGLVYLDIDIGGTGWWSTFAEYAYTELWVTTTAQEYQYQYFQQYESITEPKLIRIEKVAGASPVTFFGFKLTNDGDWVLLQLGTNYTKVINSNVRAPYEYYFTPTTANPNLNITANANDVNRNYVVFLNLGLLTENTFGTIYSSDDSTITIDIFLHAENASGYFYQTDSGAIFKTYPSYVRELYNGGSTILTKSLETTIEVNLGNTASLGGEVNLSVPDCFNPHFFKNVTIRQAPGPYSGKGTLADECSDMVQAIIVGGNPNPKLIWQAIGSPVMGNVKFILSSN